MGWQRHSYLSLAPSPLSDFSAVDFKALDVFGHSDTSPPPFCVLRKDCSALRSDCCGLLVRGEGASAHSLDTTADPPSAV